MALSNILPPTIYNSFEKVIINYNKSFSAAQALFYETQDVDSAIASIQGIKIHVDDIVECFSSENDARKYLHVGDGKLLTQSEYSDVVTFIANVPLNEYRDDLCCLFNSIVN